MVMFVKLNVTGAEVVNAPKDSDNGHQSVYLICNEVDFFVLVAKGICAFLESPFFVRDIHLNDLVILSWIFELGLS